MVGGRVMRLAVLRNPASSKNRDSHPVVYPAEISPIDLTGKENLPALLHDLKQQGTDLLAIDGGDGTVREVLSHLPDIFGSELPVIAILPRGNTNLVARKAGAIKTPADILELKASTLHDITSMIRETQLLRLDFENPDRPSLRGFIMGWGAYATATRLAVEQEQSRGARQVLSVFIRVLKAAFFEGRTGALRQGIEASLVIDDVIMQEGRRFVGLATTLKGPLTAGLNPFWNSGAAPLRWTDVKAPALNLLPSACLAILGRHMQFMTRNGYLSGSAHKIDLILDGDLVLDGEFVSPGAGKRVSIRAAENVRFISM